MTRRFLDALLLALVCGLGFSRPTPIPYIAHAGGGLRGHGGGADLTYTNSLEALDRNHALGHRVFEVDFSWTGDGELVALHDWEGNYLELFGAAPAERTRAAFLAAESRHGLTHLDLAGVLAWLEAHDDARLVTDIKEENVRALARIAAAHPGLVPRIIPQIYDRAEYAPVRALGYDDVIFTLYRTTDSDPVVAEFAAAHPLFAVTMPVQRVYTGLGATLREMGVTVYTHTVNERKLVRQFRDGGVVDGFYTDFLLPAADGGR